MTAATVVGLMVSLLIVAGLWARSRHVRRIRMRNRLGDLVDRYVALGDSMAGTVPFELFCVAAWDGSALDDALISRARKAGKRERKRLAVLAGRLGRLDRLTRQLRSISPERRHFAADALYWLADGRVVDAILRQIRILPWGSDVLIMARAVARLADQPGQVRTLALYLLRYRSITARLMGALLEAARVDIGSIVREFFDDPDMTLMGVAVVILRLRPDLAASVPVPWAALFGTPSADVRLDAIRLFIQTHASSPSLQAQAKAWATDPDWRVRTVVAGELSTVGEPWVCTLLVGLLGDPNWWVRYRSARTLASTGPVGLAALNGITAAGHDPFAADMARDALAEAWLAARPEVTAFGGASLP